MKRALDIIAAIFVLLIFGPLLIFVLICVVIEDGQFPFYLGERIKPGMKTFRIIKIRSMIVNADRTGLESTSANDNRITRVGHFIRKFKIDELPQFWNVLVGDMSVVGPRPNTRSEVSRYDQNELKLLSVKPGITDFSSIVFSDEGEILSKFVDADKAYTLIIRPWKSRLGLLYIDNSTLCVDLVIILLTALNIFSRQTTLVLLSAFLKWLRAPQDLVNISRRDQVLTGDYQ